MEIRYRAKNMEPFKDGNVLGGKFLAANQIVILTAEEKQRIEQSGGVLEIIETLVPNPLKHVEEPVKVEEKPEVVVEEMVEAPQPVQKKRGRPKKNAE